MRAVGLESFEEGVKVLDLPKPQAGPDDVLVKISHSSVNGFDVSVASGMAKNYMEHRFPVVLGKDFAGTVEDVGNGVTSASTGDGVFGVLMSQHVGPGTFAEYAVIPEAIGLATVPSGLDLAMAGALGLAGTAAYMTVNAVSPSAEETILIGGATGGVGAKAIQLALLKGARVIATARQGEEAKFVSELGAQHTVDYTGDVAAQVREIVPQGVDAAIHLAGDGVALAELVKSGGRFASTMGVGEEQLAGKDLQVTAIMAMPTREILDELAQHAVAGNLRVPVQRFYSLEEAPQAMEDFTQGAIGKYGIRIEG
jgi:NADPH2:quinone reductase